MNKVYDLIIIGAGPAGISAAIYAARAKLKTLVIDSGESGGQIRITSEVVNYPGILSISGAQLSDIMRRQATDFGAKQIQANITGIHLEGDWKKVMTDKGEYTSLGIIVATGARPRKVGFKGEEEYRGRGIGYCATCDGEFFTGLDVFVIGGGFAAAEEAIFLTRYARKVTVIVRESDFTCSKSIADKVKAHPKIEVRFNHEILEASGDNVLKKAVFRNNETSECYEYQTKNDEPFGIFVFVGYEPLSDFVKGVLELDNYGYVLTNDDMETNIPGVYAAGDIRPKKLRQLVTAVADGAVASTNAEKYIDEKRRELNIESDYEADEDHKTAHHSSMIDQDLIEQLIPIFDKFEKDVYIAVVSKNDNENKKELYDLVMDLNQLCSKLHVIDMPYEEIDSRLISSISDNYAAIVLFDSNREPVGVTYQSVGGHEFNSFVLALYNIAGPGQNVNSHDIEQIKTIKEKLNIQVGITLSCTMCPDVVQACQIAAINNPNISMEVVDISKNTDFRAKYNVMSVPALVVNNKVSFGRKSLSEIVAYLRELSC